MFGIDGNHDYGLFNRHVGELTEGKLEDLRQGLSRMIRLEIDPTIEYNFAEINIEWMEDFFDRFVQSLHCGCEQVARSEEEPRVWGHRLASTTTRGSRSA